MTQYTDHKDDILVELSLLGDQAAFEELVGRHEQAVMGTAFKVTGNQFSAQDASQDAFVSAWINLDRLKSREKFGPWVCSIAKNKAHSLIVHYRNTIPDISLDLLKNVSLSDEENDEMLKQLGLSQDDSAAELHTAVEALGEKIREAIQLHYFEGLSIAEISEQLSLPAGTVKWRLSQGRKQLRKEYGLMEEKYDDKERVLTRVMRQVEQLKLWRLKDDKTGFEKEYRQVLQAVEDLWESKEKQYALADTLMAGYWWLPGEQNDAVFARMKEAALKGHNEEVMQTVAANEYEKYSGEERLAFMRDTQIPFLQENGFVKTLGYVYFWYGCYSRDEGNYEACVNAYQKVLELLEPADVYYANALAALEVEEKLHALGGEDKAFIRATGEEYKYIDGKLYFWSQPGYSRGRIAACNSALFYYCSRFGEIIYDPDMEPGTVATADNGNTLTFKDSGATVVTPAGTFSNCSVFVFEGDNHGVTYCETAFCPGVGIVSQKSVARSRSELWQLQDYTICGGSGMVPFAVGNKWSYTTDSPEGVYYRFENVFEVTAASADSATVKAYDFTQLIAYDEESWVGNMLQARREYATEINGGHKLVDVRQSLVRAAKLAKTKREKVHTAIAANVMERIFVTDPDFNPDYTEKGRWNFFMKLHVSAKDGKTDISNDSIYSFEWKDMGQCGNEGWKVLYNFLYDILCDAAGCVWDESWVPGYHIEKDVDRWGETNHLVFDVLENENVITGAGEFADCRHITFTLTGKSGGLGYRGGKMDYWFAPSVGIVKFSRPYGKDGELDCVWTLTDYKGTGTGYFPTDDGLFRRYAPTELKDGWHGSVEYTFDKDETGTVLFHNGLGTQDRANYEAGKAQT